MEAYKFKVNISKEHELILNVPSELPTGEAEVILLFPNSNDSVESDNLLQFMSDMNQRQRKRSKEDIDRSIQDERSNWD